jgi:Domain of unknown function (DUF5615)
MIDKALAPTLRQRGYDVESCQDAQRHNRKSPDEDQLDYAARQGRAILTFNIGDFCQRDAAWKAAGRRHHGIIVSPEVTDFGTPLRLTQQHLDSYSPAMQDDLVLYLGTLP